MKTIRMDTLSDARANLINLPEKTHTKEELEQLHACIDILICLSNESL